MTTDCPKGVGPPLVNYQDPHGAKSTVFITRGKEVRGLTWMKEGRSPGD